MTNNAPETPDSDMDIEVCHGYQIAGNYYLAIAISVDDPTDTHCFTNQTMMDGIEQGAFTRAIGWAYPGPELTAGVVAFGAAFWDYDEAEKRRTDEQIREMEIDREPANPQRYKQWLQANDERDIT